jgi:hypothetical protein
MTARVEVPPPEGAVGKVRIFTLDERSTLPAELARLMSADTAAPSSRPPSPNTPSRPPTDEPPGSTAAKNRTVVVSRLLGGGPAGSGRVAVE